jgi:hypothetical protein
MICSAARLNSDGKNDAKTLDFNQLAAHSHRRVDSLRSIDFDP